MSASMTGFLSLIYVEIRRFVKSSIKSYLWFILLIFISSYSLFVEKYADLSIDRSLMTFKYGDNPMADVLIFTTSFAISSVSDVLSGKIPSLVFPTSIGIAFFILFPLMLGLTLMGNSAIKNASVSISGEKEKKTLYILATSPLPRPSIYLGKFIAVFIMALPMTIFLYLAAQWVHTGLFPSAPDFSDAVLKTSFATALLFTSIGMLVSVLAGQEKSASFIGTRIVAAASLLTTLWIMIPVIEFFSSMTSSSTDFLPILEKITLVSPFTLDLMSVYNQTALGNYINIMMLTSLIFLFLGIVTFIRQDLEY